MSVPVLEAAVTDDPINIDPGVAYDYVIPVRGETSIGYTPDANFTIVLAGRVLTVTYIGPFTDAEQFTTFPITFFVSNDEGTEEQTLNFRVAPYTFAGRSVTRSVSATSGSANIAFGSTIDDQLRVGDVVYLNQVSGSGGTFDDVTRYVVSVSGSNFQVSATVGGSAITAGATLNYFLIIGVQVAGDPVMWVGDTSSLVVNEPIVLANGSAVVDGQFTVFTADPSYVKEIVDGYHIKISSTPGGSAITPTANYFAAIFTSLVDMLLYVRTYPRAFPVIDSDPTYSIERGGTVSYTITDDLTADEYFARGMPVDLTLNTGTGAITGTAPAAEGYYPVILEARKGVNISFRYLPFYVQPKDP